MNDSSYQMTAQNQNRLAALLLFLSFGLLLLLMFNTEGQYNDGDSITHYLISRFSFKHPELFLHHWGKPIFILLSSPFSQFGFHGIEVFNILCAMGSAWFIFKAAEKLEIKNAPLAILFVLFTPVYLNATLTGLTEILFGLLLSAGIFFFLKEKYLVAAILISFLPFARSEGYLMWPLFALGFLLLNRFLPILLLGTGFLLYSIIGYFVFNDFLWIIHQNPYTGAAELYGHGPLLHFIKNYRFIVGIPLGILFLFGLLAFFTHLFKPGISLTEQTEESASYNIRLQKLNVQKLIFDKQFIAEFLLVYGSFAVLLAAHSIFWWKGIFGSLGLFRVIAAVAPPFGIICLRGFNLLASFFSFNRIVKTLAYGVILFLVVIPSMNGFRNQAHLDERAALVKNACNWVKQQKLESKMVYYSHPFTVVCLDLDPFGGEKSKELMYTDHSHISTGLDSGSIVIWESQFGPNESRTPLDSLQNPLFFNTLKSFAPADTANHYKVIVFEKKK